MGDEDRGWEITKERVRGWGARWSGHGGTLGRVRIRG